MNARIFFLKRLALGVAVSLSATAAFAQNWIAVGAPPKNWNDNANWSTGVPAANGTVTLNSGTKAVTLGGDTAHLQTLTIGSNGWNITGSGSVVLRAFGGGGTLTNNGTNNFLSSLSLAGNGIVDGTGSMALGTIVGSGTSVLNINQGTVQLNTSTTGLQTTNIGLGSAAATVNLNNGAGFGSSAVNVGSLSTLQATGTGYTGTLGAGNIGSNATLGARVGSTTDLFTFSSLNLDANSGLNIDFGTLNAGTLVNGSTFNIIDGGTTGSFGTVTDSNYSYWTKVGSDFYSGQISGATAGLYWKYKNSTGELIVVPEPSTLVFAGVGVAMAGWSAWKKRRVAKVLAKN